jgi:hypothetical protein
MQLDAFRQQIEINLVTHVACAKLATPAFTELGPGRIVARCRVHHPASA